MTNVYDKVNDLARVLKSTDEVVQFKKAVDKINLNEANKKMVDDFRKIQMELYSIQMQGKEPPKEKLDVANNLWNIINLNSDVRDYFESEMKFSKLWEDIIKILGEAVDVNMNI